MKSRQILLQDEEWALVVDTYSNTTILEAITHRCDRDEWTYETYVYPTKRCFLCHKRIPDKFITMRNLLKL